MAPQTQPTSITPVTLSCPPDGELPASLGGLNNGERFWRDHYLWLEAKGYVLRPRYKPGWIPSWKDVSPIPRLHEDGVSPVWTNILDAVRARDGRIVIMKKISTSTHPYELGTTQLFSTEPLVSHPRNHCMPIYEVLDVPEEEDTFILVMPLLRRYNSPRFQTIVLPSCSTCLQPPTRFTWWNVLPLLLRSVLMADTVESPIPFRPNNFTVVRAKWLPPVFVQDGSRFGLEPQRSGMNVKTGLPLGPVYGVIDATRISDGMLVCLKKARIAEDSKEIEIGRFFASEVLAKDARNHCVPIYSALQVPHDAGITIIVMSFLRSYDEQSLQTIGEAVDFFGQLFEAQSKIETTSSILSCPSPPRAVSV